MEICCNCGQPVSLLPSERYALIIRRVAEKYGMDVEDILSDCKNREYTVPRQEAYYDLHKMGLSAQHIGKLMRRDHTTVLHGIQQHKNRLGKDIAAALDK